MNGFNGTLDIFLASAGTGKTHQLMNIIDYHLKNGTPIDRIAFVTFTKKGAEVAQLRTAEQFGFPLDKLKHFRTIHSMAFRGCGVAREIMMDFPKYKDFGEKAGYNFGTLGLNTTEGINWNEMKDQQLVAIEQLYRNNRPYCETIMEDRVDYADLVRYMQLYVKYKNTFGYKDFTDLLEDYIASGRAEDVDVVCLDEMQDSSLLQWQMVFQAFSNAKHIYVAADVKQCQPGYEQVLCKKRLPYYNQHTGNGLYYKRLDELDPNTDELVCMIPNTAKGNKGYLFKGGNKFQIEHHSYKGDLIVINTKHGIHKFTPEHICLARISVDKSIRNTTMVYCMRRGNDYKIGVTDTWQSGGPNYGQFGLSTRMRAEGADAAWCLFIGNKENALLYEALYSFKYGIPQSSFVESKNRFIYDNIDTAIRARTLLTAMGLDIRYPLLEAYENHGWITTAACNLNPLFMQLPGYRNTGRGTRGAEPLDFNISREYYDGEVYSLEVENYHNYVTNGLTTHNCIFTYAGASPETVLNLRGEQHMLEQSYRVPSRILAFAQNIVDVMQLTDHSHCKAVNDGGIVEEITSIDELTGQFDINKSYFFLARNKKFFGQFEDWCTENGIPYCIKGEPIFTDSEKIEFREGRTDGWDPKHLDFARYCYSKGTFYRTPNVNISTIHTVKGDEADVVVLLGDISKAVASQLELDEDSEHRVFYVAVTRAKEKLIVVQPQTRQYYPYLY